MRPMVRRTLVLASGGALALFLPALGGFPSATGAHGGALHAQGVPPQAGETGRPVLPPLVLDTLPVLGSRVSAGLPLRTRGVEVLDRANLDAMPARTVADALRWATGVELSARSPAQADLQLRGGTFEQVLVLVDGVRMSDPQTGHFDLDLAVPLDRVERIEILRGPASAQYGSDAMGGVVNVVTREGESGVGARLEGGSFGTATLALNAGGSPLALHEDVRFEGGLEAGRSDGHREGTEWESLLGSLRLSAPVATGRVVGDLGVARRDFGAQDFYAPFPSIEATRTRTASLAWRPGPAARVRVEPRLNWRAHDDDFILIRENPAVYRNEHLSTQFGGDVTLRFPLSGGALVAMGIEAARHALRSNALGDRHENRGALFGELSARPLPGTDLSLGLRHDHHARWGGNTSPSVAVAHQLTPALRLRGSWGQSFRGPTWTERFYADPGHEPNPDVAPERGSAVEIGLALVPASGVTLTVAAHSRTTRDLIDWARPRHDGSPVAGGDPAPTPAPWVPRNVNRARFQGLEAEAGWSGTSLGRLSLAASLLRVEAEAIPGFESKYALRPLTEKVTLGWERDLGVGRGGEGVLASVRWTHGRRGAVSATGGGAALTPAENAFQEVDVRLSASLSPLASRATLAGALARSRIYLDGRNLLGAEHPDLTGNPVAGRAFTLGIEVGRGG